MGWMEDLADAVGDGVGAVLGLDRGRPAPGRAQGPRRTSTPKTPSRSEDDKPAATARDAVAEANTKTDKGGKKAPARMTPDTLDLSLPPEGVSPETWDSLGYKEKVQALLQMGVLIDPLDELNYKAQGGAAVDDLNLTLGKDITANAYMSRLMRLEPRGADLRQPSLGRDDRGKRFGKSTTTVTDYISAAYEMDEDELRQFQEDLRLGGFYGTMSGERDKTPMWGFMDEPTVAAIKLLGLTTLRYKGSKTVSEVLQNAINLRDKDGDGKADHAGAGEDTPTIRVTNPTDIVSAGRQVSSQLIGREDTGFAQGLVQPFQAAERTSQQGVIDDQWGGGGGVVTDAPRLGAFAQQRLEATNPTEVDSFAALGAFNVLLKMLGMAG